MPVARVVCSLTLHVQVFDELDSIESRLSAESAELVAAVTAANTPHSDPEKLNPDAGSLNEDGLAGRQRAYFVLDNITPKSWSFVFNTFRRADEAEFTIPLDLLPVPPDAIRRIVAYATVRHLSADEWDRANGHPALIQNDLKNADFAGICSAESVSIQPGEIPTIKLPCKDFLGLLAGLKVKAGVTMDRSLPISQAVKKFLVGTPAEGLEVKWTDTQTEPTVESHIPKAQKQRKAGKKPAKPTKPTQTYLDAITEECFRLGCVARVDVATIRISTAWQLYEGGATNSAATIVVSQIVESIEAEHALIGVKTECVQTVGYDPDTGHTWTARWPADAKHVQTVQVPAGEPPRSIPLTANVGLPGYEQLDESILLLPVGAVTSKERLLEMARMVFLERTRQKIRYTLKTHAPWSDPLKPDADGGSLLRLRAGDTVTFGYVAAVDEEGLLPPAVQALTSRVSAESNAALLVRAGVDPAVASRIGQLLATTPRLPLFRVDELHVAGGAGQDVELSLKLANFTQITSDMQSKAAGVDDRDRILKAIAQLEFATSIASGPLADITAIFAEAQKSLDNAGLNPADNAALQEQIDRSFQRAMEGR